MLPNPNVIRLGGLYRAAQCWIPNIFVLFMKESWVVILEHKTAAATTTDQYLMDSLISSPLCVTDTINPPANR